MKDLISKSIETVKTAGITIYLLLMLTGFLSVLAPVVQVLMVLVVVFLTGFAIFKSWPTALLTIAGLTLYATSWPATEVWGSWAGSLIFLLGFFTWLMAIYISYARAGIIRDPAVV